jgi:hypothetical protein
MAISVQAPSLVAQPCLPSSSQIAVSPGQNRTPTPPMPSQVSGSDVVHIIIAISVLVGVVLGKPTKTKQ